MLVYPLMGGSEVPAGEPCKPRVVCKDCVLCTLITRRGLTVNIRVPGVKARHRQSTNPNQESAFTPHAACVMLLVPGVGCGLRMCGLVDSTVHV